MRRKDTLKSLYEQKETLRKHFSLIFHDIINMLYMLHMILLIIN